MLTAMLGRNPGSNLDLGCPPPGGRGYGSSSLGALERPSSLVKRLTLPLAKAEHGLEPLAW